MTLLVSISSAASAAAALTQTTSVQWTLSDSSAESDGDAATMFAAALEAGGLGREVARVITGQHSDWELKVTALAEALGLMLAELAPAPKAAPRKFGFKSKTASPESSREQSTGGAVITVIGGQIFRDIRAAFDVTDTDFLGALGIRQVIGGLLMGDLRGLAEMVSEGKSGSLFFWSHDGRFLVKTISQDERNSLVQMLRQYKSYVASHPNTLLTKYLGLYDLEVPEADGSGGSTIYHLVVMANVFNTSLPIAERFDLKGSTFGRNHTSNPPLLATARPGTFQTDARGFCRHSWRGAPRNRRSGAQRS